MPKARQGETIKPTHEQNAKKCSLTLQPKCDTQNTTQQVSPETSLVMRYRLEKRLPNLPFITPGASQANRFPREALSIPRPYASLDQSSLLLLDLH